jgi:hypothetical protein
MGLASRRSSAAVAVALALAGCEKKDERCDLAAQRGCDGGEVCEPVQGGDPACFPPVVVEGLVLDVVTGAGVRGARVVALDANRAPSTAVAESGDGGAYALRVPSERTATGAPAARVLTLRADARAYQSFPGGVRVALPLELGAAVRQGDRWVLRSDLTDVGLVHLAGGGAGILRGRVARPAGGGGVMVVAESVAGPAARGASAIADRDGDYAVFNLPAGEYRVRAYTQGASHEPRTATLAEGGEAVVDLPLSDAPTATVSGAVQPVSSAAGIPTSVTFVVASTYDPVLGRGDSPPGLRAVPDAANAYALEGVPDGEYVALAAFEDDGLVRQVSGQGGTDTVHVTVANGTPVAVEPFKLVTAVALLGPGASGPEVVSAPVTFSWTAYPSTRTYLVRLFDALGTEVWQRAGVTTTTQTYPSDAPALAPGMTYQVRVESWGVNASQDVLLSQTEDLKGIFTVAAP